METILQIFITGRHTTVLLITAIYIVPALHGQNGSSENRVISFAHWAQAIPQTTRTIRFTTTTTTTTTATTESTECPQYSAEYLIGLLNKFGKFDTRYMAPTVDDAVAKFPDLTDPSYIENNRRSVCDAQCLTRSSEMRNLLLENGYLRLSNLSGLEQQRTVTDKSDATENPFLGVQIRNNFPANHIFLPTSVVLRERDAANFARHQRSVSQSATEIGKSYKISCDQKDIESSGLMRLCLACRAIRELPDTYFPRYINEVICEDTRCLNGHGKCVQKTINLDILQQITDGACPYWTPLTINVPVCCDCLMADESMYIGMVHKRP